MDFLKLLLSLLFIASPSTSSDNVVSPADNEYFKAEQLGKAGAPCDHLFPECSKSLLAIFTDVYDPLTEFIESIL
jgi:DM4/DM12 family